VSGRWVGGVDGGTDLPFGHFPLAGFPRGVAIGDLVHADPFGGFVGLDGFSDQFNAGRMLGRFG
jgi:hypothetical protein